MRFEEIALFAVGCLLLLACLWLILQRWFWVLAFGVGGLAAAFSTIASIIYFQIFGALGFFFLMMVCWGIAIAIMESDPSFRR